MRLLYILVFFGLLNPTRLTAQVSANQKIKIHLQNAVSKAPIAYAHAYNESRRVGAISDKAGDISFSAQESDTLVFIALGYYGKFYTINEKDFDSVLTLELTPQIFEIEEVEVNFPASYKYFKKAFMEIDVNKGNPLPDLPKYSPYKKYEKYTALADNERGLTASMDNLTHFRFGKLENSEVKVWFLKQQELKQGRVDKKFNRRLVTEITGLIDAELTQFIGFCNFSFDYLFETSPYDIALSIERKYKEYLNCCYEKSDTITHP